MPDKKFSSTSAFAPLVNCVSPTSASGIRICRKLVWHCQAFPIGASSILFGVMGWDSVGLPPPPPKEWVGTHDHEARIFKLFWSPGIDSKEWIPPAYVAWRAGTIIFSYSVPSHIDCLKIPAQRSQNRLEGGDERGEGCHAMMPPLWLAVLADGHLVRGPHWFLGGGPQQFIFNFPVAASGRRGYLWRGRTPGHHLHGRGDQGRQGRGLQDQHPRSQGRHWTIT